MYGVCALFAEVVVWRTLILYPAAEFAVNVDRKQLRSCTTEHGVGGDPFTAMRQLSGTHWTSRTNVSANRTRALISIQTIVSMVSYSF